MDLHLSPAHLDDHVKPARLGGSRSVRCIRLAMVIGGVFAVLFSIAVQVVEANGAPVDIFLDYIPGVTTWGSSSAAGHAVVSVGEGEVKLEVQGLPRLQGGHYQVWLERADTGEMIPVGMFNTDEQGNGRLHVLLDDLPYATYRSMVVSVESGTELSTTPSEKWALVGRFPNMEVVPWMLADMERAGASTDSPRPEFLPVTGGSHPAHVAARWALGLLGLMMGGLLLAAWRRRREEVR